MPDVFEGPGNLTFLSLINSLLLEEGFARSFHVAICSLLGVGQNYMAMGQNPVPPVTFKSLLNRW